MAPHFTSFYLYLLSRCWWLLACFRTIPISLVLPKMAGSGELAPVAGEVQEGLPQQVHLSGLSKPETQLGSARHRTPSRPPETT